MRRFQSVLMAAVLVLWLSAVAVAAPTCSVRPAKLRCEYLVNPVGMDAEHPRLSWILQHTSSAVRGAAQSAYHVMVADDPELLAGNVGNLWDTDKIASDGSIQIDYRGRPLQSRTRAYWKVRVWDEAGRVSDWSEVAEWSMGLLDRSDWKAEWIGDPTEPSPPFLAHNGYHSSFSGSADAAKWVAIELAETTEVDSVKLFPADPFDWGGDGTDFMFPVRFRIDVAQSADFSDFKTVFDHTSDDVTAPGGKPAEYSFPPVKARYVRLVANRLRMRDPGNYGLSLAEMQVLSNGTVLSGKASTAAGDSVENGSWSIDHLADGDLTSHRAGGVDPLPAPMLRREFTADGDTSIARATAYITALGLYELRINGRRVGDHLLAPEWTDYHTRLQYQTYDVTDYMAQGANAIGVIIGDGWYAGELGLSGLSPTGIHRAIYGRLPKLLLQVEIEYADGNRQVVISDGGWHSTIEGPIRAGDIMDGETYDARRELPDWDRVGFDDSDWKAVRVHEAPRMRLVAQPNEPIRIVKEIRPIAITEPSSGVYVFDMGQNMVGWCRFRARGEAGTTVNLHHAEILNDDGTIFFANLGAAAQTDRYILAGKGIETFEPHFTYHGFRFVEVSGLDYKPSLNDLLGRVFHSASPDAGHFECSNEMLNQLMRNIVWTQRANMHSIPTDCPQRAERLGWMGDILAFSHAACFNLDMAAFFTKWVQDVRDAQATDGRYPDFAPHPYEPDRRFSGTPAWGDAGIVVPWRAYQNYADVRMLRNHYDSARRWIEYIHANNPDLLWKHGRGNDYGDWLNGNTIRIDGWPTTGGEVPKEILATAFFARSTDMLSQMARVIGRDADARHYAALASDIRRAFNDAYVSEDGSIIGDTQAGYALALHFDLLPEHLRAKAASKLIDGFARYNDHASTGFQSTLPLMFALCENGYTEKAYTLINHRTPPSWGAVIEDGATTIWERWDGYVGGRGIHPAGMNSFNHYAFGAVGEWMYRTILGINLDPEVPAYKRFIIRPQPGGGLTWARGYYDSIHGRIECAWRLEGNELTLEVEIPANTSALVHVPTSDPDSVKEGPSPALKATGVEYVGRDNAAAVYRVGSGSYRFTAVSPF